MQTKGKSHRDLQPGSWGTWCLLAAACVPLLLTGCTLSPLAKRTASFSTAATATAQGAANAYQVVEQAHEKMQVEALVLTFDSSGFDPNAIKPFLSEEDLKVRTEVLQGLKQYAELLADLTSDKPLKDMDTQAKALGTAIQGISTDDFKKYNLSSTEIDAGVVAIRELGQLLIQRDRDKKLPKILADMDPHIQQICGLLQAEIGAPHGRGLRNELLTSFDGQIVLQKKFIQLNGAAMSPAEKRAEIEVLPQLVFASRQADQVLAATSDALGQLAKTHHALLETKDQKDSASFKVHLSELIQDGQSIGTFYSSLQSK